MKVSACVYEIPSDVSPECKDVMCKLLVKNPNDRMTLQEVLQHEWIKKFAAEE